MSSITDKVEYLKETKSLFKEWINNNGGNITDTTTFREYVNIIDKILTEGPPTPVEWQEIWSCSQDSPGGKQIRWYDWDNGNRDLYVYCSTNIDSAVPGMPETYCTLFTLTLENPYSMSLVMGKFGDYGVDDITLKWVAQINNSTVIGSMDAGSPDTDYTVVYHEGSSYTITLNSPLIVPDMYGDTAYAGEGVSITGNEVQIQKV